MFRTFFPWKRGGRAAEDRHGAMLWIRSVVALISLAAVPAIVECAQQGKDPAAEGHSEEKESLERLVGRLVSSWNRGDVESLAALFSLDGQLVTPSGSVAKTRPRIKQLIAKERRTRLDGTTLKQSVEGINFFNPGSALLMGKYEIIGVHLLFGLRKSFAGPFTLRLRKHEDEWSIVRADVRR